MPLFPTLTSNERSTTTYNQPICLSHYLNTPKLNDTMRQIYDHVANEYEQQQSNLWFSVVTSLFDYLHCKALSGPKRVVDCTLQSSFSGPRRVEDCKENGFTKDPPYHGVSFTQLHQRHHCHQNVCSHINPHISIHGGCNRAIVSNTTV